MARTIKPGVAFGDYITTEKIKHIDPLRKNTKEMRGFLLPAVLVFLSGILILKLITLQIINGNYYRKLSDSNRTRTKIIHAPRGIISDRNGVPLVFNTPGFRTKINGKTVQLTREDATLRLSNNDEKLEIDTLRFYPYKENLSHVLGYIGEVSADELKSNAFLNYLPADVVGKMGIEKEYEGKLKGIDGKELFEVDAKGNLIRSLGQTEPIAGENISLTIDIKMQNAAAVAMQDVKKGALIVTSPNGQILAMISKPYFDPNLFTMGEGYKSASSSGYVNVESVINDSENQPLLNRAISGTYPPGSTFKLVNAAAGLMSRTIDESYTVDDTGVLRIGTFSFANWYFTQYGKTEGEVNIVKAIKRSNDIFFYKLAEKIGVDKLSATSKLFGLGERLGIDLYGEAKGLVPTEEWKQKTIGEQWYLGDTYHYGIGQGYLLTTPLQVNAWTQVIANGGTLYEPHLLGSQPASGRIKIQHLLNSKSLDLIKEGMRDSCSPGGVAWPLFDFKIKNEKLKIDEENITSVASASADWRHIVLGCKTGTAEHGGEETLPHAWVTVIAPLYKPQIVVTVLVESSGEGSNIAAPIAKKVLTKYFEEEK